MEKNYVVVNHEYCNTGGNCMVSTFTVYCKTDNLTRFIVLNEEGVNWATADFVNSNLVEELDTEVYDNLILGSFSWENITEQRLSKDGCLEEELLELMIDCRFEYLKKDCEYFRTPVNVTYDELPTRLMNTLSKECVEWHIEHSQLFTTNGYEVGPSEYYTPDATAIDKQLKEIIDFREWLKSIVESTEVRESMYESDFILTFGDRTIKIPFHADTYCAIEVLLKSTIEDW